VVGADPDSDVAVVKIDATGLPTALLGRASSLEVGQPAIAIGSPLGLEGGPSVTVGVISALNRTVLTHGGNGPLGGMIQTDASIAAGSSGGGLFDANGTLVGITTAVALTESGTEGLGFAIPIEEARRVAEQLVNGGSVARVWLGVRGADMTSDAEQMLGTQGGAMLREVVDGGPAAVAGLAAGDVITKLGDVDIGSMSALVVTLRSHVPGETIPVTYLREGVAQTVNVTLVEKPDNP
jgi:S1-C subfamily serine protease